MCGMPLNEFWNEEPNLLWTYRSCFMERMERDVQHEQDMINFQAWLTGFYVQQAVASCFSKTAKYPKKPIESVVSKGNKGKGQNISRGEQLAKKIKENLKKGKTMLEMEGGKKAEK